MSKKPVRLAKKRGPAPMQLDEDLILDLASIMCTTPEIASIMGCSDDTLEERYMHILSKGRSKAKSSLRRKQYEVAMAGNPGMLIWMGKQYLWQREPTPEEKDKFSGIEITLHPKAIPNETQSKL